MFWSLLHRTIFFELVRVFFLSLSGITGILVMAGIVAEASQQGLNPAQILAAIPLLVPSTLPYTIPATTLFAACVVYGRLSHDNEILAIKAAGINVLKVVWPGVFLGTLLSCITLGLYYQFIPYTQRLLRSRALDDVEEFLYAKLKKDRCINEPQLSYAMWVRQVQGTWLHDALFKRKDIHGHYDIIARAQKAELRVDRSHNQIIVHMRHCEVFSENGSGRGYFEDRFWPVPLPADFGVNRKLSPRGMTWPEILERRTELQAEEQAYATEIALVMTRLNLSKPPDDLAKHLENLNNIKKNRHQQIYSLNTELAMRPALSFGCLCFVLVGCPIGIWFSRSDYLSAFITCFLPIVFLYYPLLLCGTNFARTGKVHELVAMWAADAVMALIAMMLFRKLLKN